MTSSVSLPVYTQGLGTAFTGSPVVSPNAPASTSIIGPNGPFKLGQTWIDSTSNQVYTLVGMSSFAGSVSAIWQQVQALPNPANFTGVVNFENGSTTTFLSGSTVSVNSGDSWSFGNIPFFNQGLQVKGGSLTLSGQSKFLVDIASPSIDSMGTATLSGGLATVTTTAVTALSLIFLSRNALIGTAGNLSASTSLIVPGVSFAINSDNVGDISSVNYWIIN